MNSEHVKAHARELGFDLCGIAPATDLPELAFLSTWLARRYYGTMTWLPRTQARRADVRHIVPGARSVIVTGTLYSTRAMRSSDAIRAASATVSRYAWGDDYHAVRRQRLDALLAWMRSATGSVHSMRVRTSIPARCRSVSTRMHAGLGWIGKNTCLINPSLGSWLFLGDIITTLPLDPDAPGTDQCGTCRCAFSPVRPAHWSSRMCSMRGSAFPI